MSSRGHCRATFAFYNNFNVFQRSQNLKKVFPAATRCPDCRIHVCQIVQQAEENPGGEIENRSCSVLFFNLKWQIIT